MFVPLNWQVHFPCFIIIIVVLNNTMYCVIAGILRTKMTEV